MSGASNWVHLDFEEIVAETDKAILVKLDDETEEWFPLSQVADPDNYSKGDGPGTISITEWLAKQKGLA